MASTFVNDLRLEEMATGENSGTWGTKTNTNLELIGEALGFGTESITTNADTHTSTIADATSDPARAMYIKYTGTLDSTCTITIAPNTISRLHFIENGTSGSQDIIIKQGSGATVTIPAGKCSVVYLDGAGSGAAVVDALTGLNVAGDITAAGTLNATGDTSAGDSAALGFASADGCIITGQGSTNDVSIKNDADATVIAIPTGTDDVEFTDDVKLKSDSAVLSFGADSDVTVTHVADTALLLNDAIKMTFRDSALAINSSTDGQLDIDADTEVEITAPTIDLTASSKVTVSNDVDVTGRAVGVTITAENDAVYDLALGNNFTTTTAGTVTLTFSNKAAGQSGCIKFVNGGNHTVNAHADVAISATALAALAVTGTYFVTYYVTAASGDNTVLVSATAALT
tara:strand:+ start:1375 stop:2577 length:1203 start_codon:yes stop_codon:yes gene_type:complete